MADLHPEAALAADRDAPDPAPDSPAPDGFAALDLDPRLLSTIAALGYEEPTPMPGSAVGVIQINDAFSLVDVQASVADDVGRALAAATIRGRWLQVRRDS